MNAKINLYYKDGRWMTVRTFNGTEKEIKKHAKDTLAIYVKYKVTPPKPEALHKVT